MINFSIPDSLIPDLPEKHSIYINIKGAVFELYMHRCAIMGFTDDEYEWCCAIYRHDSCFNTIEPSACLFASHMVSQSIESFFVCSVSGGEYIKDKEYAYLRDESISYKTALKRAHVKAMCSAASIRSIYK